MDGKGFLIDKGKGKGKGDSGEGNGGDVEVEGGMIESKHSMWSKGDGKCKGKGKGMIKDESKGKVEVKGKGKHDKGQGGVEMDEFGPPESPTRIAFNISTF